MLTREWSSRSGRQPGELERTYVGLFQRFAAMIAEGSFPFRGPVADSSAAPRVGDGVMVLDEEARGSLCVAERGVGASSSRHRRQRSRHALGRARIQRQHGAPGVRDQAAGDRRVRADRRRRAARALHARFSPPALAIRKSPAACCCCATSPRYASATSCCCRRTQRSARSITASRTTCRRSRRCCACKVVG